MGMKGALYDVLVFRTIHTSDCLVADCVLVNAVVTTCITLGTSICALRRMLVSSSALFFLVAILLSLIINEQPFKIA